MGTQSQFEVRKFVTPDPSVDPKSGSTTSFAQVAWCKDGEAVGCRSLLPSPRPPSYLYTYGEFK
ncbi:hypothetical protein ANCCAN_13231 [Ancylostoma caninum]|uniref:Uncharacterized protein n=1 Tax=Ancylostoma caninum TaxID=29170 RepID=A0A368GCS9_ANCCA|nr:hypothetical protein ANCCAN_13231 [Ancylostoma caninum]